MCHLRGEMDVNVQTQELPGCQVKITLSFDVDDVNGYFGRVYKDLSQRGQIHGFRPGKAPRSLVLRHYGKEAITSAVWYEMVSEQLEKATEELDVLGQPDVPSPEEAPIVEGEPYELTVTATVGPRVSLGDLSGISLLRPAPEATADQVAEVLGQLRDTHAEETDTDRETVQTGDAVDLKLRITVEGQDEPVEQVQSSVVVGQGAHFPDIDDQLVGQNVGQTIELDVTYPADYHDAALAGKSAHIAAEIVGLRERQLPELSDDFARKVDEEQFATLEALEAEVKRQLDAERARYSREELEHQVTRVLLERCDVELPEILVESMAVRETQALGRELQEAGLDLDAFQDASGMGPEELHRGQRRRARRLLTFSEIMSELARANEIEADDEEIDAEVAGYAREQGVGEAFVRQALGLQPQFEEQLRSRVIRRKSFDVVLASADLQDLSVEEYGERRDEVVSLTVADAKLMAAEAQAEAAAVEEAVAEGVPAEALAEVEVESTAVDAEVAEVAAPDEAATEPAAETAADPAAEATPEGEGTQ
jgi:trigger factor